MTDPIAAAMDRKIEALKARRIQRMRDGNYGLARQDLARIKRARTRMLKHEMRVRASITKKRRPRQHAETALLFAEGRA